jgi:hypothetical protein
MLKKMTDAERIERLKSCLMNARNILRADGYFYANDIDRVLKTVEKEK